VLYVLDEPSIGLHQRDNHRLIETLTRLRDLGNTLIVVEHDEDTIAAADWVVDIGPGAGEHGGQVVHSGTVKGLLEHADSITGEYLSGRREIAVPPVRRPGNGKKVASSARGRTTSRTSPCRSRWGRWWRSPGVRVRQVDPGQRHPLQRPRQQAQRRPPRPGRHKTVTGLEHLDKVVHVDQGPIGRTPRSNPATYTGVFDNMRKLYADTTEAKIRGYQPGRFSFNVKGGRCDNCSGDGTIKIEMNFLPDVYVPCEVCHGARYNRETLEVHFKGKTIADVLDMPIEEAAEFFAAVPAISRHLSTLNEVGLGYVRLGQPAPTLSAARRSGSSSSTELQKRSTGRTIYVLDEPTTGCTSRTSASCSRSSRGWSTRATRSSSSSTTSTSSRAPTGSSTSAPRAASAAAWSSARARPRTWRRWSTRSPASSSRRSSRRAEPVCARPVPASRPPPPAVGPRRPRPPHHEVGAHEVGAHEVRGQEDSHEDDSHARAAAQATAPSRRTAAQAGLRGWSDARLSSIRVLALWDGNAAAQRDALDRFREVYADPLTVNGALDAAERLVGRGSRAG
jgi:hypothetical protein